MGWPNQGQKYADVIYGWSLMREDHIAMIFYCLPFFRDFVVTNEICVLLQERNVYITSILVLVKEKFQKVKFATNFILKKNDGSIFNIKTDNIM